MLYFIMLFHFISLYHSWQKIRRSHQTFARSHPENRYQRIVVGRFHFYISGGKIADINPFCGKAPLWAVEELSPMEVRSSSRHRRMPIKSRGRKESPIDRRRLAFFFLALSRRFSFSCSFSFPFTLPTRVAEATEAKGCPNWEVGIMGRINMQGLDTCGGRRWRRRRSIGGGWVRGCRRVAKQQKGSKGKYGWRERGFPFSVSVSPTSR